MTAMTETVAERPETPQAPTTTDFYAQGVAFMLGRGVPADLGMAAACFLNATDVDDRRGLYAAGMMYLKGIGVTGNAETATGFLHRSSAAGFAPARKVLKALSEGADVGSYPIVVPEAETDAPAIAPDAGGLTPLKVLAGVALVIAVAGGGGGFWYVNHRAEEQRMAAQAEERERAAADRQQAAVQLQNAELERRRLADEMKKSQALASAQLSEAEAQRQRLADQVAQLAAVNAAQQSAPAPAPTPAAVTQVAADPAAFADWNGRLAQATPHLRSMLEAALGNNTEAVLRESGTIRAMPQPGHGDRKVARKNNTEALAALGTGNYAEAVASLTSAVANDPGDEEIATNLGYALVKAQRFPEAQNMLQHALYLNSGRSSAWYNFGLAMLGQKQEKAAYAAFLLTYQFAGIPAKSREWFERVAADDTDPALRSLAQRLLASPLLTAGAATQTVARQ